MMYRSFKNIISIGVITATIFTLGGCNLVKDPKSKMTAELLKPEERKFQTYEVKTGSVRYEHRSRGTVTSKNVINLSSSIAGGVMEKVYVNTWAKVKKGDLIAKYYTKDIENKIQVQEVVVEQYESDLKMLKGDNANQYKIDKAELELKREKIRLGQLIEEKEGHEFRSPIDGIISKITKVRSGSVVEMNEVIATIMDANSLLVVSEANDKAMKNYFPGMKGDIEVQNKEYNAVVKEISTGDGTQVKNTRAAILEFKDQIPKELKIDDIVIYKVYGDEKENVIVIPVSFLKTDEGGKDYVYVIKDDVREKRIIETGTSNGNVIEVKTGLVVGENIILK